MNDLQELELTAAWLRDVLASKEGPETRRYLSNCLVCVTARIKEIGREADRDHRDRIDNEVFYYHDAGDEH